MIRLTHGIYDYSTDKTFKRTGYFDEETREYLPVAVKLRRLLFKKADKFFQKYKKRYTYFTHGIDPNKHIEVITICHPIFDVYNYENGEKIVIGRIARMRGDIKDIKHEQEIYFRKIFQYTKIDKETGEEIDVFKTVAHKRNKLDANGEPIIISVKHFKPYSLFKRYRVKDKNGSIGAGELMYPWVTKLEVSADGEN